jgi:hypothetical protein
VSRPVATAVNGLASIRGERLKESPAELDRQVAAADEAVH